MAVIWTPVGFGTTLCKENRKHDNPGFLATTLWRDLIKDTLVKAGRDKSESPPTECSILKGKMMLLIYFRNIIVWGQYTQVDFRWREGVKW